MKKLIFFFIFYFILCVNVCAYSYEQAIQEVADAYYNKNRINNLFFDQKDYYNKSTYIGGVIQYDSKLKKFNFSPEDAQVDRIKFTVCSSLIYQIYKETFNISLPNSTEELVKYAQKRSYDKSTGKYNNINTHEVHYASKAYSPNNKENGLNNAETIAKEKDRLQFYKKFSMQYAPDDVLKVGDIVVFRWVKVNKDVLSEAGHALMVYSVNEKTGDVKFVEADYEDGKGDKTRNLPIKPNSDTLNNYTNPLEDYIYNKTDFYDVAHHYLKKQNPNKNTYLTKVVVIRPMENQEKKDVSKVLTVNNSFLKNKTITKSTKTRLDYKGLVISKVSSGHYGLVMPDETLEYKIEIKNNSSNSITLPKITETYETSKVKVDAESVRKIKNNLGATTASAKNGIITLEGIKVKAGEIVVIKYNVTVKNSDSVFIGTEIKSTGSVGNIKNATIVDRVGYKLNSTKEKNAFHNALLINSNKQGIEYVNDVFINYYEKMGIKKSTVLYGPLDKNDSGVFLYHSKSAKNGVKVYDGLLNNKDEFIEHSYLRALGKYSLTEYHNIYSFYNKEVSDVNIEGDWIKSAANWDSVRRVNYPVSANLCDGDVIWITDHKDANGYIKEYVFIYYSGKIYSNYNKNITFKNGMSVVNSQKNVERFLANLDTFRAYAIFRPLQYYGIETGALKISSSDSKNVENFKHNEKSEGSKEKIEKENTDDFYTGDEKENVMITDETVDKYDYGNVGKTMNKDDVGISNINKGKVVIIKSESNISSSNNSSDSEQKNDSNKKPQNSKDEQNQSIGSENNQDLISNNNLHESNNSNNNNQENSQTNNQENSQTNNQENSQSSSSVGNNHNQTELDDNFNTKKTIWNFCLIILIIMVFISFLIKLLRKK